MYVHTATYRQSDAGKMRGMCKRRHPAEEEKITDWNYDEARVVDCERDGKRWRMIEW